MALQITTEALAQMRQTRGVASSLMQEHLDLVDHVERLEAWIAARTN